MAQMQAYIEAGQDDVYRMKVFGWDVRPAVHLIKKIAETPSRSLSKATTGLVSRRPWANPRVPMRTACAPVVGPAARRVNRWRVSGYRHCRLGGRFPTSR